LQNNQRAKNRRELAANIRFGTCPRTPEEKLKRQALNLNWTRVFGGARIAPVKACASFAMSLALLSVGCGTQPVARVDGHIKVEPRESPSGKAPQATGRVPDPVRQIPLPPPPQARIDEVRYSVTVKDVPVDELLFAISRDTKVNIDVHPGIEGRVTLNAIDQTLKQILTRVSKQVDMRYEIDGPNLVVMRDSPYLKLYRVDHVNMSRDSTSSIGVQTQVVGPANLSSASGGSTMGQNTTQLRIDNTSKNRFWESLEKNVKDLLRETDKLLPEGSSETFVRDQTQGQSATSRPQVTALRGTAGRTTNRTGTRVETTGPGTSESQVDSQTVSQTLTFREASSVIVNPETGTLSVRATSRQHEKIAEFIAQVSGAASRQVLIEATVVEITLNDNYQGGVDWSSLGLEGLGYSFRQSFVGTENLAATPFFSIQYRNPTGDSRRSISSTVKLLSSFGTTKVLSSPRITAMNNQTSVMKVVENKVYFTVKAEITPGISTGTGVSVPTTAFTTTPNVVPEGFVLNVTPQISDGDIVTLNVRPSITRIVSFVKDPNPDLARVNVVNQVPQIQTREFETVMRVPSGMTAVLGGLMQDTFSANRDGIPLVSRIPLFGDAASFRNDTGRKTELFVFLRPIVIKDASIDTDFAAYRKLLPDNAFFKDAEPLIPGLVPGNDSSRKTP
jgi:MSHA biogenesis protein MshL